VSTGSTVARSPEALDQRVEWYRRMLEIRLFEDKVQELFMQGQIEGTTHLCQGQEAVSVGAVSALGAQDYLTITYRGHGHALARGMEMPAAFGELMGLTSGCCGGVGGSMHLTDFSRNLIGAFAIIGAGLSVAVGAGLSAKMRGSDAVALSFFGDGATNIGTFHEALNMASVWKVPVVFVIENNLYGEYSPLRETTPLDDLAERAKAHAMPGVIVDGQDVDAVYDVVSEAVARARGGDGPTLVEAKTYRYRGHSRTDPAKYRAEGELERWKLRDPIDLFGAKLAGEGLLDETAQRAVRDEVQQAVDAAAEQAAQAAAPTIEEIESYVYAS
jgi:TPP-dependent pyruvate/acetoin dehydrogenase alpha subunit